MRVWRISREPYPLLDGEGARRWGGRWNSPGTPMVYAASTPSLAVLESLAARDEEDVPEDLALASIHVPDDATVERLSRDALPMNWQAPLHERCRAIGDAWVASRRTLVLVVPSAVLPEEVNYLLNPLHRDIRRCDAVSARRFVFDPRLVRG
jgi:RES domain-containing protein